MGERLTRKWTPTLEEAYGSNVGRAGELRVVEHLLASPCENVIDYETDQDMQKRGIDISFVNSLWGDTVTLQVKENYKIEQPVVRGAPAPRYFYVEDDLKKNKTLRNVEADYMIHVNVEHELAVLYETERLANYIQQINLILDHVKGAGGVQCIRFTDKALDWFKIVHLRKLNDDNS